MNSLSGRFLRLIGRKGPMLKVQPDDTEAPKKTSSEWAAERTGTRLVILDPDGWDRSDWQYSFFKEPITEREFLTRLSESTIRIEPEE